MDRRTTNTTFKQIAKLSPSASQFHDSALAKNTIYYYRLRTNLLDSIDLYSYPISAKVVGIRKPFLGSPAVIPGIIQAENFDIGGEGQTYHDSNNNNSGGAYRLNEGVDIETRPDSGFQIGYVATGEWTQYSVHVIQTGLYRIDTYTASTIGGGKYSFTLGQSSTGNILVPKTNDSNTLAVSSVYRFSLDTGNQILTFKIITGTSNPFIIDRFVFVQDTSKSLISKQNLNNGFTISPNPAVSTVKIRNLKSNTPAKLDIYNILGVKIRTENLKNSESVMSLDEIEKGIYIFVLTSNNSIVTKKIIVQK